MTTIYITLSIYDGEANVLDRDREARIISQLIKDFPDAANAFDASGVEHIEGSDWNECEGSIAEFSKQYPNLIFDLSVTEDQNSTWPDAWSTFIQDGRAYTEFISVRFPDVDLQRLKFAPQITGF